MECTQCGAQVWACIGCGNNVSFPGHCDHGKKGRLHAPGCHDAPWGWSIPAEGASKGVSRLCAERLWDLAILHGHGWARYFAESWHQGEWTPETWGALKAKARSIFVDRATRDGWVEDVTARAEKAGEDAPVSWINLTEWWRHTTGSGTLSWELSTDGSVTLTGRVRTAPGRKDRRIVAMTIPATGTPRIETFGKFPALSQGDSAQLARNWDHTDPPAQYDYTWGVVAEAARICGVVVPSRPVDPGPVRLPRSRAGISAAI